jgi:hypothetical protein
MQYYFRIFLFILLFQSISFVYSQPTTFEKWYNFGYTENGFSVQPTFDGGYIIAGRHGITFSVSDLLLIKIDSLGVTKWSKFIKSGSYEHEGWDVKQTADSGYIITGMMTVMGGGANVYLVRTDKNGDTVWTKNFGNANYDIGWRIQPTFDGGYAIAGGKDDSLAFLIKTDSYGDTLWSKTYLPVGTIASGFRGIQQMSDSGFVLCGSVAYSGSISAINLIRTNKNGDTLWSKIYNRNKTDLQRSLQSTSDGGYIIAGITPDTIPPYWNCFLIKTNASGDTMWTRSLGGSGDEAANQAYETLNGEYVLAGYTSSFGSGAYDFYLVRTDSNGNLKWQKTFGGIGGDYGYDMDLTSDGGFIIVGSSDNSTYPPMGGVYLVKTDSNGIVFTTIDETLIKEHQIIVYPNPFSTTATVLISEGIKNNNEVEFSIEDILGRQLMRKKIELQNASFTVERNGLPSGMYLLKIFSSTELLVTKKIIIQ